MAKVIELRNVGQTVGRAVQPPAKTPEGKEVGTLYTTFINITDMKFVLVYKLDNSKVTQLDLKISF